MANSRKSTRKTGNVTQLPGPSNAVDVAEPPEEAEPLTEAAEAAPAAPTPTRPLKKKDKDGPTADPNFFQRLKAIPMNDWGSRVYLYLYVLEPLCNLKQSGGKSYLNRYSEPVQDEHQIMLEYGSGRYRLMLAQNKVSPEGSNEIARHEFEIMNKNYPPTIPRAAWINDSRNAKWEAMLPKEAQPGSATAASTIVEAMKMVGDIRRDVREEMDPGDEPQTRTSEVLETMRAAKELFGPSTPVNAAAADNPLKFAVDLAQTMMQMKADNPMIDMYRDELKAAREEMKEMRAAALAQVAAPAEKPKTFIEQMTEFKTLKELFTTVSNGSEAVVRAGRTGALDVVRDLGSKFFESDLATGVGQYLASIAQRNVGGPMQPNPAQPQVQQKDEVAVFDTFIREVVNPALMRQYSQGFTGMDFAGWMFDAFPDRLKQLQNLTHQRMPGMKGAPVIIAAYQNLYPDVYRPLIAQREGEASFAQFVNEFCAWKPEEEQQGPEQQEPIDAIPVEPDGEETPERI